MPAEALLQAAGQNFRGAGETAIQSQNAETSRLQVERQPGIEASKEAGATERQRMEAQSKMAVEQLKYRMGETEFPPELAMVMAKDLNDPSVFQLSGLKMNNRLMGGLIAEKYKAQQNKMKAPKVMQVRIGSKTVPVALERNADDTDWTLRQMGEGGPTFDPNKPNTKEGADKKMTAAERKNYIASYEKREADLAKNRKALSYDPNDSSLKAIVSKDEAWLADNRPKYDQLTGKQATEGGYTPPVGGAGVGSDLDKAFGEVFGTGQ